jgi:hypothetical protein
MFGEIAGGNPTTAEELLIAVRDQYGCRFGEMLEHRCYVTIFCKSAKHGLLEVSA